VAAVESSVESFVVVTAGLAAGSLVVAYSVTPMVSRYWATADVPGRTTNGPMKPTTPGYCWLATETAPVHVYTQITVVIKTCELCVSKEVVNLYSTQSAISLMRCMY